MMRKVLLVENDDIVRMSLKNMNLWGPHSGFCLTGEAKDGRQALNLLARQPFDLVMADIRLPELDGVRLLVRIANDGLAPWTVILSDRDSLSHTLQGLEYGVCDYLLKPLDANKVRTVLERAGVQLALAEYSSKPDVVENLFEELFGPDTARLKEHMRYVNDAGYETAGGLADKALDTFGSNLPHAANALGSILLDVVTMLCAELPWLDKFVDWRSLLQVQAVGGATREEVRQRFITAVHRINRAIAPFVRLETCGSLSKNVQTYLLTHMDEAVTVTSLAAAMHFNTHHLSKTFKKQTGINLNDYITEMKMARARLLIGQGRSKVSVIAELLGFHDAGYFSRLFRERVGQTPTEYRRSIVWFHPG